MTQGISSLSGKVAIVSGSCSGIGACIARELSARSVTVIINYPFPYLREAAEKVLSSLPNQGQIIEADLSTLEDPKLLVEKTVAAFGKIDLLINNAGISSLMAIDDLDEAKVMKDWDQVNSVNGRGTFLLTRAVLPHLSKQNSRIVNISSTTSRAPEHNMSIYAGSKGMIESFSRAWAKDFPRAGPHRPSNQ